MMGDNNVSYSPSRSAFIVYPKAEIVHGFLILCFGTPALADCYPLEAPESSEENPNNERNG